MDHATSTDPCRYTRDITKNYAQYRKHFGFINTSKLSQSYNERGKLIFYHFNINNRTRLHVHCMNVRSWYASDGSGGEAHHLVSTKYTLE